MKAVSVLVGVRGHEDAGTKKSIRESCCRRALLELSLNVLQGAIVVNGELEPVFQMLEEAGDFWWAGIKWEAFCPEYCATLDGVVHVFQELLSVARCGLGGIVWRDGCAD